MHAGLSARLRDATREAHERLEAAMPDLASAPTLCELRAVLERFHGFHLVWEGEVAAHPGLAPLVGERSRLPHLRADLIALGTTEEELGRLPACGPARGLAAEPGAALGSLYVMEGSTLGGQIISRALAGADWAPAGGLRYFNPYGRRTGAMWRALQAALDATPEAGGERVVDGALRTFAVLEAWMAGAGAPEVSAGPTPGPPASGSAR